MTLRPGSEQAQYPCPQCQLHQPPRHHRLLLPSCRRRPRRDRGHDRGRDRGRGRRGRGRGLLAAGQQPAEPKHSDLRPWPRRKR